MYFFNSKRTHVVLFVSMTSVLLLFFQNCGNKAAFVDPSTEQVLNTEKEFTNLLSDTYTTVNAFAMGKSANLKTTDQINNFSSSAPAAPLNLGFHLGQASAAQQPLVEEFLFPRQEGSPWYLAQWKKIKPLRPSEGLQFTDQNRSLYILKNPNSDESQLSTTLDLNGNYIYNLESKQGYLTNAGGSNLFLSADIKKKNMANLNREIFFSFDTKLIEKQAVIRPEHLASENQLLQRDVVGVYVGGFPVQFDDGIPEHRARFYIQFYIADTRIKSSTNTVYSYRGFDQRQNVTELIATLPVSAVTGRSSDLKILADSVDTDLTKYKINLNQLLCRSLQGEFSAKNNSSEEKVDFSKKFDGLYTKNLKHWSIGAVYLGFQTQANYFDESKESTAYFYPEGHELYNAHDIRQDIKDRLLASGELYKGDVKLKAQVANLEMKAEADPFDAMDTCDDVFKP